MQSTDQFLKYQNKNKNEKNFTEFKNALKIFIYTC